MGHFIITHNQVLEKRFFFLNKTKQKTCSFFPNCWGTGPLESCVGQAPRARLTPSLEVRGATAGREALIQMLFPSLFALPPPSRLDQPSPAQTAVWHPHPQAWICPRALHIFQQAQTLHQEVPVESKKDQPRTIFAGP